MDKDELTALGIGDEAAVKVLEMSERMRGEYEKELADF